MSKSMLEQSFVGEEAKKEFEKNNVAVAIYASDDKEEFFKKLTKIILVNLEICEELYPIAVSIIEDKFNRGLINYIGFGVRVMLVKVILISDVIDEALKKEKKKILKISDKDMKINETELKTLKDKYPSYEFSYTPEGEFVFEEKLKESVTKEQLIELFKKVDETTNNLLESYKSDEIVEKLTKIIKKNSKNISEVIIEESLNIYPHSKESYGRLLEKQYGPKFFFSVTEENSHSCLGNLMMKL